LEDRELKARDALNRIRVLAKQDGDVSAPDRQPPGSGQATPAVAAATGKHRDPPAVYVTPKFGPRMLGQAAAGVLHHLDQLDAHVFDHQSVDFAHLIDRYGRDQRLKHSDSQIL
jgi:hypothetical protein